MHFICFCSLFLATRRLFTTLQMMQENGQMLHFWLVLMQYVVVICFALSCMQLDIGINFHNWCRSVQLSAVQDVGDCVAQKLPNFNRLHAFLCKSFPRRFSIAKKSKKNANVVLVCNVCKHWADLANKLVRQLDYKMTDPLEASLF